MRGGGGNIVGVGMPIVNALVVPVVVVVHRYHSCTG